MTTFAPPVVSVRLCECGHRVWEYADGRPTLFELTPIPHEPHPVSDDDRDWIDWYIRTDEALGDFAKAFADRLSLFAESVDADETDLAQK